MNIRTMTAVAAGLAAAALAGCGGSGGVGSQPAATQTAISGKAADGYLYRAEVFLDLNGNYRLDSGEPFAITDSDGAFTLLVTPGDEALYPVVVRAVASNTYDIQHL